MIVQIRIPEDMNDVDDIILLEGVSHQLLFWG